MTKHLIAVLIAIVVALTGCQRSDVPENADAAFFDATQGDDDVITPGEQRLLSDGRTVAWDDTACVWRETATSLSLSVDDGDEGMALWNNCMERKPPREAPSKPKLLPRGARLEPGPGVTYSQQVYYGSLRSKDNDIPVISGRYSGLLADPKGSRGLIITMGSSEMKKVHVTLAPAQPQPSATWCAGGYDPEDGTNFGACRPWMHDLAHERMLRLEAAGEVAVTWDGVQSP